MKHHFKPLLHKELSVVIIHIGANDAPNSTSWDILNTLLMLKSFITDNLPKYKIVISLPTLHTDD